MKKHGHEGVRSTMERIAKQLEGFIVKDGHRTTQPGQAWGCCALWRESGRVHIAIDYGAMTQEWVAVQWRDHKFWENIGLGAFKHEEKARGDGYAINGSVEPDRLVRILNMNREEIIRHLKNWNF